MHIHTHTQNKRYKPKIKRACEAGFQGTGRAWRRPCVRLICLPECVLSLPYVCDLYVCLNVFGMCLTCEAGFQGAIWRACLWQSIYALRVPYMFAWMCLLCALRVPYMFAWMRFICALNAGQVSRVRVCVHAYGNPYMPYVCLICLPECVLYIP